MTYRKQGNEYRKMPYGIGPTKYCDFFKNDKWWYDDLLLVSNLPAKTVCPWPQGKYTIKGYTVQFGTVPPYFNGDFMVEGIIKKGKVVVNGYQIYASIVRVD